MNEAELDANEMATGHVVHDRPAPLAIRGALVLHPVAGRAPVVELEDGHWTDENSTELLRELIRQMRKYPIFLIVTSFIFIIAIAIQLRNFHALRLSCLIIIFPARGEAGDDPGKGVRWRPARGIRRTDAVKGMRHPPLGFQ